MRKIRNDAPIILFKHQKEWAAWLKKNHAATPGIWMRFYKKNAGAHSITHEEALDEALCYGWIDGQLQKYDEHSWLQKFTPRRAKSIWSKKNAERAEQLIKLGKMKPAGLQEIEKAKADGRWERAYDSPGRMTFPDDFLKKLSRNKKTSEFFESLNRANKYAIAWRLQTAKKPETREKRMTHILEMLSQGKKFH
ncbi:MAG: YdeI/OmpD-associated family protein [Bacteroidota bacterium]|nr:YdeI/OmpD-associated family protein [Bacteroidota bacterium]